MEFAGTAGRGKIEDEEFKTVRLDRRYASWGTVGLLFLVAVSLSAIYLFPKYFDVWERGAPPARQFGGFKHEVA